MGAYKSDYDLLVVANQDELTDLPEYCGAEDHLLREYHTTHRISAAANSIVHSPSAANRELTRGRPFFVDIVRDGIILYEAEGHDFAITVISRWE